MEKGSVAPAVMVRNMVLWPGPRPSIIPRGPIRRNPMAFWLFKEEPGCYSFADLQRDEAVEH